MCTDLLLTRHTTARPRPSARRQRTVTPRSARRPGKGATTLVAVLALAASARAAEARVRVAIPEFQIEGDQTPALAMSLQDGFVLGLVRAGVHVIDPQDVGRRLERTPELVGCDSSPCLKRLGVLLDIGYVVRVKVEAAGNSYKMVARVFSTQGAAPAALPVDTRSKSCDVCTTGEARESMIRLADDLKGRFEESADAPPPPPSPPPPAPSRTVPILATIVGTAIIGVGIALVLNTPVCDPSSSRGCEDQRARAALGGGLAAAGLATAVVGGYVAYQRSGGGHDGLALGIAARF